MREVQAQKIMKELKAGIASGNRVEAQLTRVREECSSSPSPRHSRSTPSLSRVSWQPSGVVSTSNKRSCGRKNGKERWNCSPARVSAA